MKKVIEEEEVDFLDEAPLTIPTDDDDDAILREFGLTAADLDGIDNYREDRDDYYNDPYSEY